MGFRLSGFKAFIEQDDGSIIKKILYDAKNLIKTMT